MVTMAEPQETKAPISLERLYRKDPQEYSRLLEHFGSAVYSVCLRILGHAQDAEDALQETFLRFYQMLPRYDSSYPLRSWLLVLARHTSLNLLKKKK